MDRREYNDKYSNARREQKRKTCKLCGKECTSFCKSHTLPQMILRNIKSEGKIGSAFWGYGGRDNPDCLKQTSGVKEAGVFYEICDDCDNSFFQEYEDPQKIINGPNALILQLVALKTSLFYYHKYRIEQKTAPVFLGNATGKEIIINNNLIYEKELEDEIVRNLNGIKTKESDFYHVLFWKKLDYIIPIAYQGLLALNINFSGIYKYGYNLPEAYIMLFPLKDCSIVCLFCKNDKNTIEQIAFSDNLK
ncbi:MAG: hypothetical protein WBI07_07240 [Mobilitalea sp.]